LFILISFGVQIYSNRRNAEVYSHTHGAIRSRQDLLAVKGAIDLSMKLAVIYILLFVLFVLLMALSFARGGPMGQAALCLLIFGVVTLPVGLIGKTYEKRIKTMCVESSESGIEEKFGNYLKQWNEPHFGLSD
jgi:ABC-type spermidine/putrescine transport system permease subunit II